MKCFKGTYFSNFGGNLLNSLKFTHGKITTNKVKNRQITGQDFRLTKTLFYKFGMKFSPVLSSGNFCDFFRGAILAFEKKTLVLVWGRQNN